MARAATRNAAIPPNDGRAGADQLPGRDFPARTSRLFVRPTGVETLPRTLLPTPQPTVRGEAFLAREAAPGTEDMSRLALFYLDHGLAAEAAGVLETSSVPLSPAMQEAQWTARLAVDRCDEVI
ncbi:MAG: hypothetical protein AAGK25_08970, partial [Pseudomonadota bacterium]